MSVSFTVDEVVNALYLGILNRKPDDDGFANAVARLTSDAATLAQIVSELVTSPERFDADLMQKQIFRALYRASLGREPDQAGLVTYSGWMRENFKKGVIQVADALHHSDELQRRLLPRSIDGMIVDHSPHGEFRLLFRYLAASGFASPLVVEVGVRDPKRTVALDLAKMLDWEVVLVEPDAACRVAIDTLFAGTNYRLIAAQVLAPDLAALSAEEDSRDAQMRHLGFLMSSPTPVVALGDVLRQQGVPADFAMLAVSSAPDAISVLNQLAGEGAFSPKFIVFAATPPIDTVDLRQLGLIDSLCERYDVVAVTDGSLVIRRK